jgi:hypothetical protein
MTAQTTQGRRAGASVPAAGGLVRWPVWTLELFTGAKSFRSNPILGSRAMNRMGLHVARKVLAHAVTAARRSLLSPLVPAEARKRFRRDGYVALEDFMPPAQFEALRAEADALLAQSGRRLQEGDTITELALVDEEALAEAPALAGFFADKRFLDMASYIGARLKLPRCYVQSIHRDFTANAPDPQKDAHSDTFFPTLKGWLFLDDVDPELGPFHYSPGSHRLTWKRLAWEYGQSLCARSAEDPHTASGSLRAGRADLERMGLPEPRPVLVKANTLVLADTGGFHRRGEASDGRPRRAIYVWMRSNPYNPILGFRSRAWRRMELAITKSSRRKRAPSED